MDVIELAILRVLKCLNDDLTRLSRAPQLNNFEPTLVTQLDGPEISQPRQFPAVIDE